MTVQEGKALLEECFRQFHCKSTFDKLFCYKYGNQAHARDYQHDKIKTDADFSKAENAKVAFVVKCFIHMNFYVAWPKAADNGNGVFYAYKKDLIDMEQCPDGTCKTVLTENDENSYYFKGREGIMQFMKQNVIS